MTWVYPTAVPHVTSHFNLVRRHPVTGRVQPHWGTDYRARTGTPIRAAAAGVVTRSLYGAVPGNYVRIDHGDGIWTGYSHLSRRDVKVGDRVKVGEVIGLAGATGGVTAAHLHFEVFVGAVNVDPHPWLAGRVGASTVGGGTGIPTAPSVPGTTTPTPIAPRSWFEMATETDLARVVDAALAPLRAQLERLETKAKRHDLAFVYFRTPGGQPAVASPRDFRWAIAPSEDVYAKHRRVLGWFGLNVPGWSVQDWDDVLKAQGIAPTGNGNVVTDPELFGERVAWDAFDDLPTG